MYIIIKLIIKFNDELYNIIIRFEITSNEISDIIIKLKITNIIEIFGITKIQKITNFIEIYFIIIN